MKVLAVLTALLHIFVTGAVLAQEITVDVVIPELVCKHTAARNAERDHVYMLVCGNTPSGRVNNRLPKRLDANDLDNYQFQAGDTARVAQPASWKNKDFVGQGSPQIWSGSLALGEAASFVVSFLAEGPGEQVALRQQAQQAVEEATAQHPAASLLVQPIELIPEKVTDYVIGCFGIVVGNINGELVSHVCALGSGTHLQQKDRAWFYKDMRPALGASLFELSQHGSYSVIALCRPVLLPPEKLRIYTGQTRNTVEVDSIDVNTVARDETSRPLLTIGQGVSRMVRPILSDGERFYFRDSNEIRGNWLAQRFDTRSTVVLADFRVGGELIWASFTEVPFESNQ